jgi:hypothetical protein
LISGGVFGIMDWYLSWALREQRESNNKATIKTGTGFFIYKGLLSFEFP